MPKRKNELIPDWLDINALKTEIEELTVQYRQIRDRLALATQILATYQTFQDGHQGLLFKDKRVFQIAEKVSPAVYKRTPKSRSGAGGMTSGKKHPSTSQVDLLQAAMLTSTTISRSRQTRADLFIEVLKENAGQPLHYKQVYDLMRQKDPNIEWKSPAPHLRTLKANMRKHGDDRVRSTGQGYYIIIEDEELDQNEE